jgi:hypothetical protein
VRIKLRIAALAAALTVSGCGGGGAGGAGSQAQQRAYAAGQAALRSGDLETAYEGFRTAGSYRDAPARLIEVRRTLAKSTLALARSKLRTGHPRAALALAGVATQVYGDTSPDAIAVLHQAQAAQARHHQQQLAEQNRTLNQQGAATRPSGAGP